MIQFRSREGAVIVLYALAMTIICMCLALALDMGYLFTQKGYGQLTSDITALSVLGSMDRTQPAAAQLAYINDQVHYMEKANGLPSSFYTIKTEQRTSDGDVIKLTLNAKNPLQTMMLNLIGIHQVNVGIESVVVRGFIRKEINPNCTPTGDNGVGLFGCARVEIKGGPLMDSYNSALSSYNTQAIHPSCGSGSGNSMGGHHSNGLREGGHGGHGDGAAGGLEYFANRKLVTASNRLVDLNGSFCYHGDVLSSLDTNIVGSGLVNGNVDTEHFTGDSNLVQGYVSTHSVPDINLVAAVGQATESSNNNGSIAGNNPGKAMSPLFVLTPAAGSYTVTLQAGKKYYFKNVMMPANTVLKVGGNPNTAGPAVITLDGDMHIAGNTGSDLQPTRPGWLKVIAINGSSDCARGSQTSGEGHRGNHGYHDDEDGNGKYGGCKEKGNNGVGNGEDPQPPGNPPVNDGPGTSPGNPGNKSGMLPKAPASMQLGSAWMQSDAVNVAMGGPEDAPLPAFMRPNAINLAAEHDDSHDDSSDYHNEDGDCGGAGHTSKSHADQGSGGTASHTINFDADSIIYMDLYAPGYNVTFGGGVGGCQTSGPADDADGSNNGGCGHHGGDGKCSHGGDCDHTDGCERSTNHGSCNRQGKHGNGKCNHGGDCDHQDGCHRSYSALPAKANDNRMQVGSVYRMNGGAQLADAGTATKVSPILAPMGVSDAASTPVWMRAGALNLASEEHFSNWCDKGGGRDDRGGDTHGDDPHYGGSSHGGGDDGDHHGSDITHDNGGSGDPDPHGCTFYGRIICDEVEAYCLHAFHYDESLGGCIANVADDTASDGERIHLVN